MGTWHRLSVDVDLVGNVLGASIETHEDDERVRVSTVPVGPFDTPDEALKACIGVVGVQLALFP